MDSIGNGVKDKLNESAYKWTHEQRKGTDVGALRKGPTDEE